ncbi:hypothetical protein LSCM1_04996 [Leishmania martiniquensis]|uniref:Uncharacterized protein n=1 Tax=Leishmania martiniquensis TaxID=1580590 RepID=A0A836HIZ1_9TRYP|nr:hypothetical protein LSCM1_04996 [Leishmania martiniquensis]
MENHAERTTPILAASIGTLNTPPSVIWATGNSALTEQSSRSSSCSIANEQRTFSFPSSSEGSYKRSGRAKHRSGTAMGSAFLFSSPRCEMGVTQGCRKCIIDEYDEEKRQYFLRQQCPQRLSWVRVGGNALPAMVSFEEVAANSLRASHSLSTVFSVSSGNWEEPRDLRTAPARDASRNAISDMDSEAAVQPPARFGHTAVLYRDSQILIFGGKASEECYFNDVYQYDASTRRWSCLQEGCADAAPAALVASERGSASPSYVSAPPASLSFSTSTSPLASARWADAALPSAPFADAASADPPSPHYSSGSANNNNNGGQGYSEGATQNEQSMMADERLTTGVGSHRDTVTIDDNAVFHAEVARRRRPAGRVGHAAALYQDTMYVLSGEQLGRYCDDMWALDIPSLGWRKECSLPFSPRKGHTMHLLPADFTAARARQDMLVIFGGLVKASRVRPRPADPELPARSQAESDFACAPTNAVLLYYPTQRRWCQLKTCGEQPCARFYHVSQLITGTALLLVFGGRSATPARLGEGTAAATEGAFLNDLHILDVSTGFWRHIRDVSGDIPSPRMCTASVFVNDTFGVFAGGGDAYCEDAFEFSLQSRRWQRLKPSNQPACSRPTVTYTKDRLVFFGGFAPRTGVMSCTMELCLSPLSLKNQCLLWWYRCAFDKHIRSCTKSRAAEMEEKAAAAAAAAAMERGGSSWFTGCGGQVTLQCSPAATAHSSPLATPQPWGGNRGLRRPAPLRVPSFDHNGAPSVAASAQSGAPLVKHSFARASLTLSPTPPFSPSSPVAFSPLSRASKSMPSLQDAGSSTVCTLGGGTTATAFCSPASVVLPTQNLFPSCPGTALASSRSPSQAGSPATVSAAASASQVHLWPPTVTTFAHSTPAAIWGSSSNNSSAMAHPHGCGALAASDASVVAGAVDCTRRYSAPSPATPFTYPCAGSLLCSVPSPSHTANSRRSPHPTTVTAPGEQAASACFMTNCTRNLGGYVAASLPRPSRCFPSQAPPPPHAGGPLTAAVSANTGRRGGTGGTGSGSWCFSANMRHPASPLQGRAARMDTTPFGLSSSPQPVHEHGGGGVGYRQSPSFMRRSNSAAHSSSSSSFWVSPQQHLPAHGSTQLIESASSRASSAHSVHSTSAMSAAHFPSTRAKRTIQRLEGTSGPYLLQALAARLKLHEAETFKAKRTV